MGETSVTANRSRGRSAMRAALAVAVCLVAVGCGADDQDSAITPPSPVPTATTEAAPSPTAAATRTVAGDVQIDLSAFAAGALPAAAATGPLDVQTCLGGQCFDHEVDPATIGQETLALDASGRQPGATLPVTVRVTAADGTVLVHHTESVTLAEGETTVAVEPRDEGAAGDQGDAGEPAEPTGG